MFVIKYAHSFEHTIAPNRSRLDRTLPLNSMFDFFKRYANHTRDTVIRPEEAFRRLKESADLWDPTLFMLVNLLVPKVIFAIILLPFTLGLSFLGLIPSMLFGVLFIAASTLILYGVLHASGYEDRLQVSYQILASASVANYIGLIPIPGLNSLLFCLGFSILIYFGLRETCGIQSKQAIWVAAIPGLFSLIASLVSMLITIGVLLTLLVQVVTAIFLLVYGLFTGLPPAEAGSVLFSSYFYLFFWIVP